VSSTSSQRALDDAVIVEGARAGFVLLFGNAEEQYCTDAGAVSVCRFLAEAVDGTLRQRGQAVEGKLHSLPGAHEQRQDEVGDVETRLANERA
jgi:hypothetical protein